MNVYNRTVICGFHLKYAFNLGIFTATILHTLVPVSETQVEFLYETWVGCVIHMPRSFLVLFSVSYLDWSFSLYYYREKVTKIMDILVLSPHWLTYFPEFRDDLDKKNHCHKHKRC